LVDEPAVRRRAISHPVSDALSPGVASAETIQEERRRLRKRLSAFLFARRFLTRDSPVEALPVDRVSTNHRESVRAGTELGI
jgi:hypothetical protein